MTAIKGTPPAQSADQTPASQEDGATGTTSGLAELAASMAAEASQRLGGAAHRCQTDLSKGADRVDGLDKVDGTRSRSPKSPKRGPPTPAARPHRYALEAWVNIRADSEEWISPEDDSYSEDFVVDTVNQIYPGCTGAYLAETGHVLMFFGKKGGPKAGLTQEQSVVACCAVRGMNYWMGSPARLRVRAVSLTEAGVIVESCKRMFKEDLRRAKIELRRRVSSTQHASVLSATAGTFEPAATSSGLVPGGRGPPTAGLGAPMPTLTTDDEGMATDASTQSRRPRRRGRGRRPGRETDGAETDASASSTNTGTRPFKKRSGVSNKVEFPKFGGKKGHPQNVVEAFRTWERCISHQRNYYEDEFLLSNLYPSLSGDASQVYDWVVRSIRTPDDKVDLGTLLAKFREHYCGSLTFREQRNQVENLRQGSTEDAVDFLIRVGSAIERLAKEWSHSITREEADTLQYDVCLNGVKPGIRHVLDSEIAAYGRLNPERMYEAVKRYETYMARGKRLETNSPYTGQQRAAHNKLPRTTAFAASVAEPEEAESVENGDESSPGDDSGEQSQPEGEAGGVFLPDFLGEAEDGNWGLNVRMAAAMQEYEKPRRKCFLCQSLDHLMRDCPDQKNYRRPLPPKGPYKNKSAVAAAKAKVKPSSPAPPAP